MPTTQNKRFMQRANNIQYSNQSDFYAGVFSFNITFALQAPLLQLSMV